MNCFQFDISFTYAYSWRSQYGSIKWPARSPDQWSYFLEGFNKTKAECLKLNIKTEVN